jgi:hypothetical protein
MVKLFLILQVLDFATTMFGFVISPDTRELSPAIQLMIRFGGGNLQGLVLCKILAIAIFGLCFLLHRTRVVKWANYFFTGLVLWNIGQIAKYFISTGGFS